MTAYMNANNCWPATCCDPETTELSAPNGLPLDQVPVKHHKELQDTVMQSDFNRADANADGVVDNHNFPKDAPLL